MLFTLRILNMAPQNNKKKPSPQANGPERESFDQNELLCAAEIVRLWPSGNDIMARVRITGPYIPDGHQSADEGDHNFSMIIPNGEVGGVMVTLSAGDIVKLKGYLVDYSYQESCQRFLRKAKKGDLFEGASQREKLEQVTVKRYANAIVPTSLELVESRNAKGMIANRFRGSGLVVKETWRRSGNLFARVASYDRYTEVVEPAGGKGGRPRRKSHYWSMCISGGQIDGKDIVLKKGQRIRLTGTLASTTYLENLHEFMVRGKAAGLLAKIKDMDTSTFTEIKIFRSGLFVLVNGLVQFS
jgi:hypothetical protein